jgi:RNA polymerase sigma factor (sigma-70 family)
MVAVRTDHRPIVPERSFATFADAQWPSLWRFFYRLSRDPHLAEDLAQDTLLRLLRRYVEPCVESWPNVSSEASAIPGTWPWEPALWTTARNLWIDLLRARHRSLSLDGAGDLIDECSLDEATRVEFLDVASGLRRLPPDQQQALVLQVIHGASHEQIARCIHVSVERVHYLLHRARYALRGAAFRTRTYQQRRAGP